MEKFLQIAPHSLAIVLSRVSTEEAAAVTEKLQHHHTGYEIFADFKAENMQHFWNKKVTDAISETFFLGWIDEHVLLIQGKEDHLEVLREGWTRRALKPPRGFEIKCIGKPEQMASHGDPCSTARGRKQPSCFLRNNVVGEPIAVNYFNTVMICRNMKNFYNCSVY